MSEVNPDHLPSPHVDHEVWQMSVSNTNDIMADREDCMCHHTFTSQHMECFRTCTDVMEWSSVNMSRVMRKPTICICENKDADQLRGNREADQRLCFRYLDSTIPLLPKSKISSLLPSPAAVQPGLCQTWSESTLLVFSCCGSYDEWISMKWMSLYPWNLYSRPDDTRFFV